MDMHRFSDAEGLRVAMEMERRGGGFYQRAARVVRDENVVSLLVSMAEEEKGHLAQFGRLYEEALSQGRTGVYSPERCAYLSSVAADIVFSDGLGELVLSDSAEEVLESAIRSEEGSIAFYTAMAEASPAAADTFLAIADTERTHLSGLHARLNRLQSEK